MEKNALFYEDIYQNCPDMIMVGDVRNGKIFDANQTLLDKTGYTLREIQEMPSYHSIYHPDCQENLDKCAETYIKNGFLKNYRLIIKKKSGGKIPVAVNITGLQDHEGNLSYTRVVLRDITELLNIDQLKKENHDLNILAQLISHDLKSPLSAVYNLASWIEEDCKAILPPSSIKHLDLIKSRIKRVEVLLQDLSLFLLMGEKNIKIQKVVISELIEFIKGTIDVPVGFKLFDEVNLSPFLSKKILLQQVLSNLILNAIKHHHQPHKGEIRLKAKDKNTHFIFSVEDNGPGIAPQFHKYIFGLLMTLKSRDIVEGSGIGLAIVKKIIIEEGGKITVRSRLGQGSKFIFTWPKILNN